MVCTWSIDTVYFGSLVHNIPAQNSACEQAVLQSKFLLQEGNSGCDKEIFALCDKMKHHPQSNPGTAPGLNLDKRPETDCTWDLHSYMVPQFMASIFFSCRCSCVCSGLFMCGQRFISGTGKLEEKCILQNPPPPSNSLAPAMLATTLPSKVWSVNEAPSPCPPKFCAKASHIFSTFHPKSLLSRKCIVYCPHCMVFWMISGGGRSWWCGDVHCPE